MNNIVDEVKKCIEKHNMIEESDKIVVGVSGGADSICLLHMLRTISDEYDLSLVGVHLNHKFRGKDADDDAEYVREICRQLGVKAYIEEFDVPKYIEQTGLSPEEAGREIRYGLFERVLVQEQAQKIAVAQNLNDNVETILMRFMRGTGIDGLKGIEPVRDNIIRPLLNVSRLKIEEYCRQNKLEYRVDKTNLEPIYLRNKIRLELIPYIKNNFNSNLDKSMIRFAEIIRDENDYLDKQASIEFARVASEDCDSIKYNIEGLKSCHPAIRKRLIRLGLIKLNGSITGFEQKHIEAVLDLLDKSTGAAVMLTKGNRAYVSYDSIILSKHIEKKQKKCYYSLIYGVENDYNEIGASIKLESIKVDDIEQLKKDKYTVYIDRNKLQYQPVLRNREEGDRFSPIGMRGSKKLKEYFIDEKIPKEKRDEILLVADGQEIVWIIGNRISEKYKITSETTEILKIKFQYL